MAITIHDIYQVQSLKKENGSLYKQQFHEKMAFPVIKISGLFNHLRLEWEKYVL